MKPQICTLVFLVEDNRILLALKKRGFGKGLWNGAGGKLEPCELVEQAMIRECQEEIGVTPTEYEKVALHEFTYQASDATIWVHAYLCQAWLGEPIESAEMVPQWFSKNDIPYDQMWSDDKHWLPQVLTGQKLHTKFTFNAAGKLLQGQLHQADNLELDG